MDSSGNQVAFSCRFFRVYKDGRVQVYRPCTEKIPPSEDPRTGVRSKDVVISPKTRLSARIFIPQITDPDKKLPLLFYIHGGGFCMQSAFYPIHHHFLNFLVSQANAVAVSINYGIFPGSPIPACYEDSWAGLQWVASHAKGDGPDDWLNDHADFKRVSIGGNSAGGNISHNMAVRVGKIGLPGLKVVGLVLIHPFFGGTDDDKMWLYMCPSNGGLEDPRLKPTAEDLARLGCERVLVFVAEIDHLREVAWWYYEELKRSGWKGKVEILETQGEKHSFHLLNLTNEKAVALTKKFASFINQKLVARY